MYQAVDGYQQKPQIGTAENDRKWYLDFGIVFHKMLQTYYSEFRLPDFNLAEWAFTLGYKYWMEQNLDRYVTHPECHQMGGLKGFGGMLIQYATRFTAENERLRIIGTEIAFGKNKEVLLYVDEFVEVYLAGRLDVIVDDGFFIMPMDHKTTGSFKKDPLDRYLNDEGPTGYVFALQQILPTIIPREAILKRECTRILMNLISKQIPTDDPSNRFKRMTLYKSGSQLATYRARMIATVQNLLNDLVLYIQTGEATRDTSHCTNWFFGRCFYYDVCRQPDATGIANTLANGFVKLPIWDTENISVS